MNILIVGVNPRVGEFSRLLIPFLHTLSPHLSSRCTKCEGETRGFLACGNCVSVALGWLGDYEVPVTCNYHYCHDSTIATTNAIANKTCPPLPLHHVLHLHYNQPEYWPITFTHEHGGLQHLHRIMIMLLGP